MMKLFSSISVIYVGRNVSDCLVSFYNFQTKFTGDYKGNFEDFTDLFMRSENFYGDFWDNLKVI